MIRTLTLGIGLTVFGMASLNCSGFSFAENREGMTMSGKTITEVLKEHTKELMSVDGVVGTAQGLCDTTPCIKVYVIKITPELVREIPDILEGYPVMIEETGEIKAFPESQGNNK